MRVESGCACYDVVVAVRVLENVREYIEVIVVDTHSIKLHLGNNSEEVAVSI